MPPKSSYTLLEDHIESYFVSVAKGEIPGSSGFAVLMNNPNVLGAAFEDIWGAGGIRTEITAPEAIELVSDNLNDTSLGTGARTILMVALDENFVQQNSVIAMNGLTAVPVPSTHLNIQRLIVISSGSSPSNVGNITARVQGSEDPRSVIRVGYGISRDGFFWIPDEFNALAVTVAPFWPKDQSGSFRVVTKLDGSDQAEIIPIEFPAYQTGFSLNPLLPGVRPARSQISFRANSLNPNVEVNAVVELLIYPNTDSANQTIIQLMEKMHVGM